MSKYLHIAIVCFVLVPKCIAASDSNLPYKEGELLVRFAPKTNGKQRTTDERDQILSSFNAGAVKHSVKLVPGLSLVKLPENLKVKDALSKLRGKGEFLYIEPNYKIRIALTFPNDTYFTQLWGMHNTVQTGGTEDADIDALDAWDIATGANDIIVAVIDTGVDYTHPDLAGNMWVNEAELNGAPNVDDDNNGYIDDIYGYDFCTYDDDVNDPDPMDDCFHGTHCAGTIGAVGNNKEGVTSVCWNVKIMALKFMDSYGYGWSYDAIKCIQYAVDNGAKVLSNSWRYYGWWPELTDIQALKNAAERADANGVLVVAAAGNESLDNDYNLPYPASYDCNNIIAVLSTDKYDEMSDFSNYGPNTVDLGAPGSDILSTFPTYQTNGMTYYGFYTTHYETISGTSMATPHVAGACALVWGMNPALSHLEVKDILLQTVDVIFDPNDEICRSNGRLNLYYALAEAGTQAGKQAVLLNKIDDVNGPVLPGDSITYTISFENTVRGPNDANFPFGDLTNVKIVDHLPAEVDCNNPFDPNYNSNDHTYTWNIGTLQEDDSDSVELTVVVNNLAEPLGKITNVCVIEANEIWPKTAIEITDVNCWNPGIIYVDMDAVAGDNTGMSWEHAYTDLQDTLEKACNCYANEIWVAEGTYKPTDKDARSVSFELVNNVAVYGGFPPGGGTWTERNPNVYETILSGDIAAPNDHSDNSYHVVKCENVNNAVLDGFTITAGNAYDSDPCCGGGIYCQDSNNLALTDCNISGNSAYYGGALYDYNSSDVNITNCLFSNNLAIYGGGTYIQNGSSSTIINCVFSMNTAENDSGGIFNSSSELNIANCIFTGNDSKWRGGGVYSSSSELNITNCLFTGNTLNLLVDSSGGGMYNYQSSGTVDNCIFSGNTSKHGGGISNDYYSEPNITNCIFAGNIADSNGGAMYNYQASPSVINCIFTGNCADDNGGGIANDNNSSLALTNCTVSGNSAYYGGGICNWNAANTNLTNCIFWDNEAAVDDEIYDASSAVNVNYSDVKGGWSGSGVGNINEDPCFFEVDAPTGSWSDNAFYDSSTFQSTLTDANANWVVNELAGKFVSPNTPQMLQFFIVSNDVNTIKVWSDVNDIAGERDTYYIYDYHLSVDSACIDRGDPNGDYTGQTDIDGEPRLFDGDANGTPTVDMGADEYYWSPADIDSDGFVNFFDYALFAGAWLTTPNDVNYYDDIYDLIDNNYIDSNDLARFCEDWLWQTAWAKAFPFAYDEGFGRSMGMGMGETFFPSIQAKQARPELTAADIEEILKWLAELWLTDEEVRKMINEDEWLKIIEAVIQAAKQLIYY